MLLGGNRGYMETSSISQHVPMCTTAGPGARQALSLSPAPGLQQGRQTGRHRWQLQKGAQGGGPAWWLVVGNAGPCVQLPVQRAFGKTPWELPEPSSDKEQEDLACAHSHLHTGVPYTEPALWMAKEGLLLPETQLDFISGAGPARRLWGCWLRCCSAAEACDTCRCDAPKGRRPSADPPMFRQVHAYVPGGAQVIYCQPG